MKKNKKTIKEKRKKALLWTSITLFALAIISGIAIEQIKQSVCTRSVFTNACTLSPDIQFAIIESTLFGVFAITGGILFIIWKTKK